MRQGWDKGVVRVAISAKIARVFSSVLTGWTSNLNIGFATLITMADAESTNTPAQLANEGISY